MSETMVRCVVCKYVGPGRVPKGGDGSGLVPYPHKRWEPGTSGGSGFGRPGSRVWCEGRFQIAEELARERVGPLLWQETP